MVPSRRLGEAGDFLARTGGAHTRRASDILLSSDDEYFESGRTCQGLRIERRRPGRTEDRTCQRKLPLLHGFRHLLDGRLN